MTACRLVYNGPDIGQLITVCIRNRSSDKRSRTLIFYFSVFPQISNRCSIVVYNLRYFYAIGQFYALWSHRCRICIGYCRSSSCLIGLCSRCRRGRTCASITSIQSHYQQHCKQTRCKPFNVFSHISLFLPVNPGFFKFC